MKAKELPLSFSISTGKAPCRSIAEYGEMFSEKVEEHPSFNDLMLSLVEKYFLGACQRMMPLLEPLQINDILIKLDIGSSSSGTIATYDYGKSDAAIGKYEFTAKSGLIIEYLADYFFDDSPLSPSAIYTWEHELIHMLDHHYISELEYNIQRPDMTEVLVDFILSFRSEGMAEIFYFMKNHSQYRSIQAARTQFLKKLDFLSNRPWDDPLFAKMMYRVIRDDHRYYTVGTWMVLHVLGSEEYAKRTSEASEVADKIRKRVEMTDEEILRIIRQALEIDNYSFIDCLTKPGPDGKPFVKHEELEDLARYVELCKTDLERNWSQPAQLRGDPKIVGLFRLLRPKS